MISRAGWVLLTWGVIFGCVRIGTAQDYRQWGGSSKRNNSLHGMGIVTTWDVGKLDRKTGQFAGGKNIKWHTRLGSQTYGTPVVSGGRVFIGTNNGAGFLKGFPPREDLGCLVCFRETDGKFLWQHSNAKLRTGRVHDWPMQGVCSTPLVEGDRLWYVSNRGEVVCLDTAGYFDGEDDGPIRAAVERILHSNVELREGLNEGAASDELRSELKAAGFPLPTMTAVTTVEKDRRWRLEAEIDGRKRRFDVRVEDRNEWRRFPGFKRRRQVAAPFLAVYTTITADDHNFADEVWKFDMMKQLGTRQHNMANCSVTSWGDALFVCTSNGVDESHENIPAPDAPSFIALDKHTGKLLWKDNSPGKNILHGQWSSPAVAELGGVPQVLFGGGDGWLYSFRADRWKDGKPELLWKFDCNPKRSKWLLVGRGKRNVVHATPVIYEGRVYIGTGQDPEHGEGDGVLWCIDPTKRGDVSQHLVVSKDDAMKIVPHHRLQAAVTENGEVVVPNPNSAAIWHYDKFDQDRNGKISFYETMHRCFTNVAIKDGLLITLDFSGLVHCLDAKTGNPHWTCDLFAQSWAGPLIVEDNVYVTDEDGDIAILKLSADLRDSFKMERDKEGALYIPLNEINMKSSVYCTPVVANGVLYITTKNRLFAIARER